MRYATGLLIVVGLCSLLVAAAASPAAGQCAPSPDITHSASTAESVFVGEVIDTSGVGRIARVEVLAVWKGRDLSQTVEVRGASAPDAPVSSTDRRWELGRTYLFIPENSREPFLSTICSATQPFNGPPLAIPPAFQSAVGAEIGRPPVADATAAGGSGEISIVPVLGVVAVLLAGALLVSRIRSRQAAGADGTKHEQDSAEPTGSAKRLKRRNVRRDMADTARVADRKMRRYRRRMRGYRRRQNRQLASSRKAKGSTETS